VFRPEETLLNNRQHGEKQAMKDNGDINQNRLVGSRLAEMRKELEEDGEKPLPLEETHQIPWMSKSGQGSIAYELLLLQQRLDAYEQLHIDEMAELRQEIERLRRAFLQETNPKMYILAPERDLL